MYKGDSILILGGRGLVGSALNRCLKVKGYENILSPPREELDLKDSLAVTNYFKIHQPKYVFNAAAKVGGILANNEQRTEFILENLVIQNNVFDAALKANVQNLLFLGSSCIYPKLCPQPIKEEYLLTGPLEFTNEPYAIAKIAGLKTAESIRRQYGFRYFSVMPTNLYGINDNFHPTQSHVIPGLIARMTRAKSDNKESFEIWGTGKALREFLYVDDMAEACIFVLQNAQMDWPFWINVGYGSDISIADLASIIAKEVGFNGKLSFDQSKPDGTPKKLLESNFLRSKGWEPKVPLELGIKRAVDFYRQNANLVKD